MDLADDAKEILILIATDGFESIPCMLSGHVSPDILHERCIKKYHTNYYKVQRVGWCHQSW